MSTILGNPTVIKINNNRPDLLHFVVDAGKFSGEFQCNLYDVSIDGEQFDTLGDLVDAYVAHKLAVRVRGVDDSLLGGSLPVESREAEFFTVEKPVTPEHHP